MDNPIRDLFDPTGFPPRWHCGSWSDTLGWLHVLSDTAIFLAYTAIPVVLAIFLLRRRDTPFPRVLWLFVAFICTCGLGHLIEAVIFWHPIYRFAGLLKFVTAVVSWTTVGALVQILPQALRFQSPAALEREVVRRTTELSKHARELEAANRELDAFAAVASHDLRTPLDGIRSLARWISEDNEGVLPEPSQEHLRKIHQRIDRLAALLDGLLEYSRAGRLEPRTDRVSVEAVVSDIVAVLAPPRGVRVVTTGPLPTFETEQVPFQQVLRNLVDNAIKHHDRPRGTVTISCEDAGDAYQFAVADDGPGISPQYHEQIFRLFGRLRPSDEVEGSGLGLALVRRLVGRLGGEVSVHSPGGRGATFRFTWPKSIG